MRDLTSASFPFRLRQPIAWIACVLTLMLIATPSEAELRRPGTVKANAKTCDTQFLYDTGASVTIVSRKCAKATGLMKDDGTPVGNTGEVEVKGTPSKLWCYKDVDIEVADSAGTKCSFKGDVYVSQKDGDYVDDDILGDAWRKGVKGCYQEDPPEVTWPWNKKVQSKKVTIQQINTKTGETKTVVPGVVLISSGGPVTANMAYYNDSPFSFLPESKAVGLGPQIGLIDLAITEPKLWNQLQRTSMLPNAQTSFKMYLAVGFNVGFGPVVDQVPILAIQDSNADFGIMGRDLMRGSEGEPFYGEADDETVLFLPAVACYPDCDGSGDLNIDDFICFQTLYALGDPTADCDASGDLNIDDFICFQTFYAIGC